MSSVLLNFGPDQANETAVFCDLIDTFFDCLNIRNTEEWQRKRKPFLKPYYENTDIRFDWLINTFLKYFESWKNDIETREGKFARNALSKMFISWQSFEGIFITCHSIVGVVQFLLNEGMEYVLTNRFCQDPVEEYFGCQRQIGRRSDNPDLQKFGYGTNTIRIQKYVSSPSGNTRGAYDKKRCWENVTNEVVPRRKAKK